jgi:linoleoyl-CoA desaturase
MASVSSTRVRFIDKDQSEFFSTVKSRVDAYFKENNLSKNANGLMYFKSVLFIGGLILFYGLIISNQFSPLAMLFLCVGLGMCAAFNGFNVCHDAIHGAYSANPVINKRLSYIFNMIGANAFVWSITHNVVHHTYTNMPGHDEDIEVAPGLIRLSPEDKVNRIQRFQHYYAFLLYGLASLSWVFKKDYVKFFQKKIGNYDNSKQPKGELFNLFFFKAFYYAVFIAVPLIVLDITWWQFIIGFVVMHISEGFVLGLVFQLAHIVEGVDFPYTDAKGNIENAWAIHQMETTANFATKSFMATFLCGGLNMQVEHHLFPKVCHVHYPVINEIVKKTAHEFNVAYIENPTFLGALKSHYIMLKKFSNPDYPVKREAAKKEHKEAASAA